MSLSLYFKENKQISSEITTDNILNYKRRSNLVSKSYNYEKNKIVIDSIKTLKNCYDALYDMKNIISDYIYTKKNKISISINDNIEINKIIEKYKTEILSTFNILNNYNNKVKEVKDLKKVKNKEETKILKNITNILQVLQLLYLDLSNL